LRFKTGSWDESTTLTAIFNLSLNYFKMRAFLSLGALFPLIGLSNAGAYPPDVVDKLAQDSLPKLKEYLAKNPQGNCTYENAVKRREWYSPSSPRDV